MFPTLPARRGGGSAASLVPPLRNPLWPGLAPLSLGDRRRFFGREVELTALSEKLRRPSSGESPVVWLHGDSGAAKTSLANAGLPPQWSDDAGSQLVWLHLIPELEHGERDLIESIASGILREVIESEKSLDLSEGTGSAKAFSRLVAVLYPESGDLDERRSVRFGEVVPEGDAEANELVVSLINGRVLQIAGDSPESATTAVNLRAGIGEMGTRENLAEPKGTLRVEKISF